MIKIAFSAEDIDKLYEEQMFHGNPRTRKKFLAVYLKSLGLEHGEICRICRISWPTMLTYFKEYRDGGIKRVTLKLHQGHPSELNTHRKKIKAAFKAKCPATLKEAKAKIKEITGIERSIPQIWGFLHKLGLRSRKVGGVPGKADVDVQEDFKKKSLNRGSNKRKEESAQSIS